MITNNSATELIVHAQAAFDNYKNTSLLVRSELLYKIADEIEQLGDALIDTCMRETNLPETRLRNEKKRTCFQLTSYGDECKRGNWLQVKIDTADNNRTPVKPSIRKMMVPLGPVVVFGAANFPFAFSTAGGDTASALAAGCTVVVKAHPGHPATSLMMATAIANAIRKLGLPAGVFNHCTDTSVEAGQQLVLHPFTKAVGFTGSLSGGKAICDLAWSRKEPIPVFAEMSSVNPIFLLPEKLHEDPTGIARLLAGSVTLNSGQFCTKPGILIGIAGESLDVFTKHFSEIIAGTKPANMLHETIGKNFRQNRELIINQPGVGDMCHTNIAYDPLIDIPTFAITNAMNFLENPVLQTEVFGPFSLLVTCSSREQMQSVAQSLDGQLTATLLGTINDLQQHTGLIEELQKKCGRLIVNNVPTGVEVCSAMQHGGPWPAASIAYHSSVGSDAIQRFSRPLSFQNWPYEILPAPLQDNNPLQIWRTINNELTKEPIFNNV